MAMSLRFLSYIGDFDSDSLRWYDFFQIMLSIVHAKLSLTVVLRFFVADLEVEKVLISSVHTYRVSLLPAPLLSLLHAIMELLEEGARCVAEDHGITSCLGTLRHFFLMCSVMMAVMV